MIAKEGHKGLSVSEDDAIGCIPESLYMFLYLLHDGGQRLIENNGSDVEGERRHEKWS